MTSTLLTAYLPVLRPSIDESFIKPLQETLEELCMLSETLEFNLYNYGILKPKIELINNHSEETTEVDKWLKLNLWNWKYLKSRNQETIKISVEVPISRKHIDYVADELGEQIEVAEEICKSLIVSYFEKRIYDLILVANIARIGSLEITKGVIFQDKNMRSITDEMYPGSLREASIFVESKEWPKLQKLNIEKVWDWIAKQEGFLDGFSCDSTSQALNAITHLLEFNVNNPLEVFWALIGIEALYVNQSTKAPVMEQVREKIHIILGSPTSYKKVFGKMYDFRSAFVHGRLNFPGRHLVFDAREDVEKYGDNSYETSSLAIAILIATIQELIIRGWKGLKFSYEVSDVTEDV
jgi:hypothetical protein